MGKDDLFRRSFEAGTAFLDMTRERAEAMVKELVKAGEVNKGRAQKLVEEVLDRSRKGTEELREVIRREITAQVAALGLATKDDIARLEARLDSLSGAHPGPAATPTGTESAPVQKAAPKAAKAAKAAGAATVTKTAKAAKAAAKAPGPAKEGAPPAPPGPSGAAGPSTPSGAAGPSTPTGGPPANDATPG